jgi:hypothetical protein
LTVTEQQQGKRVQQARRRCFAEKMNGQSAVTTSPEKRHQAYQEHIAHRQGDREPPGDDVSNGEADHDGQDVEAVSDRIQDLPESGGLVEMPGEIAVEVVGETRHCEHGKRPAVLVRPEHQPQEERDAEQASNAERVRDRHNAARHGILRRALHLHASCYASAAHAYPETPYPPTICQT